MPTISPFYMRYFLLTAATIACLTSCSSDSQNRASALDEDGLLTFNDFESMAGWIPENNSLTREVAHSGNYSIKVEPGMDFSLAYDAQLGQVTPRKPRKIKLEAWAYVLTNQSTAKLGLQIADPATGQTVFGDGIELLEQVKKYRTWVPISKEIPLPDSIAHSHHLKVFLWRNYFPEVSYIDDVRISIID